MTPYDRRFSKFYTINILVLNIELNNDGFETPIQRILRELSTLMKFFIIITKGQEAHFPFLTNYFLCVLFMPIKVNTDDSERMKQACITCEF